jgi:phosphatidylglycerol---prolipoprotein diacylglyceryl transferase
MYPILFTIGNFPITTYGLMIASAFMTGLFVLKIEFKRLSLPEEAVDLIFWRAAVGGLLGARLYYVFLQIISGTNQSFIDLFFSRAGMVFFGGLIGGTALVLHGIKRKGYPLKTILDALAPVLIISYGIGRIGCFFAGCCYGHESSLPWAVTFTNQMCSAPLGISLHPTQLYETLASLGIFTILWNLRKKMNFAGGLFAIYISFVGAERLFVEFFRDKDDYLNHAQTFTMAQLISTGLIIFGIALFSYFKKQSIK